MTQLTNTGKNPKQEDVIPGEAGSSGPRSLMRLLNIFHSLAKSGDSMSLAELSAALVSPKSSLLSLLRPLVQSGFLTQATGRYSLGPKAFQLSLDILSVRSFSKLIRTFLLELAERSGESVYLATIDRTVGLCNYVEMIESQEAVRYAVPAGTSRPLFVSAAGRTLLAFQPPEWRDRYIKSTKMVGPVTKAAIDKAWLKEELERIQETGIAISLGEAVSGASGIAAPIISNDGTAMHALMIAGPTERFQKALPDLKRLMLEVAPRASDVLRDVRN